jgi:hypothetical protein
MAIGDSWIKWKEALAIKVCWCEGDSTMKEFRRCKLNGKALPVTMSLALIVFVVPALSFASLYEISKFTISSGGGMSSSGLCTFTGIIGQPVADYGAGGNYELLSGFWPAGPACMAGIVNFLDYAKLAEHWLEVPCNAQNNWCGGADLDQSGEVDNTDLKLFVDEWLLYRCSYNWTLR